LDLALIPEYPEFRGEFIEICDAILGNIILESTDERLTPLMKTIFKNDVVDRLINGNDLPVYHANRYGIGRFYPDNNVSMVVQPRIIKHTLYEYLGYLDIDQVKGHPTIISEIGRLNNVIFEGVEYYINNFQVICDTLIEYYAIDGEELLDKDNVKHLFNITIYGGGFSTWREEITTGNPDKGYNAKKIKNQVLHPIYIKFKNDCDEFKRLLLLSNPELLQRVSKADDTDYKNENRVVSYFCGVIENHALYIAYEYLLKCGVIKSRECGMEYDGLNIPPYKVEVANDALLEGLNRHIYETMGINITYKFKGYETVLTEAIKQRKALECDVKEEEADDAKGEKEEPTDEILRGKEADYSQEKARQQEELNKKTEAMNKSITESNEIQAKINSGELDSKIYSKTVAELSKEANNHRKEVQKCEKAMTDLHKKYNKDVEAYKREQKKAKDKQEAINAKIKQKDDAVKLKEKAKREKEHIVEKLKAGGSVMTLNDDNEAGAYFFKLFKDKIIYYNKQLFMKKGNVWINDRETVEKHILELILESNVVRERDNVLKPYAQNYVDAIHIKDVILIKVVNNPDNVNIIDKFHTTTKGRLCFKDGVLDFKTKMFYKWENITFEYYTPKMIDRNYGEYFNKPNLKTVAEVKSKIYDTLFGDRVETALKFLSRGIAGHSEDKNFATYIGNRNCGKSLLFDNQKAGFGDYVGAFQLGNILYERAHSTEEISKKMYWAIDLQFLRLAISQETPAPEMKMKVNGEMLKKLASGGDTITARRNFDREDTTFTTETTLFFMGNGSLEFDTPDVYEQCLDFSGTTQFKTREEIQQMKDEGKPELLWGRYKVKDATIKDKAKTEEWSNATVYLMLQYYTDKAVPILRKFEDNEVSLREKILITYEITGKKTDEILVCDVEEAIGGDKKKIRIELESMRVMKVKCSKGDMRNKYVYQGIKLIVIKIEIEVINK
jgi:hypothetical protein